MKLIVNADENDWFCALYAAMKFRESAKTDSAILVVRGIKFLIRKNHSSISVYAREKFTPYE